MTEPFRFSNGQQANSVEDLIKICQESPHQGIHYLKRGDLENWLTYIGEPKIAQYAQQARESSLAEEEQLHKFLIDCQGKQPPEAPAPSTAPPEPPKTAPPEPSPQPEAKKPTKKSAPEPMNPVAKFFLAIASLLTGKNS